MTGILRRSPPIPFTLSAPPLPVSVKMNDQTKIEDITRQQEEQSYGTGLSSATVAEHCAALSGSYKRRGVAGTWY